MSAYSSGFSVPALFTEPYLLMSTMSDIQGADRLSSTLHRWASVKAILIIALGCLPLQTYAVSPSNEHPHKPTAHHGQHKVVPHRADTRSTKPVTPQRGSTKHSAHAAKPSHSTVSRRGRAVTHVQQGKASYYGGAVLNGRLTASGERFNQNELTAAHPSLPFGTRIRVTNLTNQRQVVVRINDRGPFVKGRILDLSTAAAQRMNMTGQGVAQVKLEVLGQTVASSHTPRAPVS